MEKKRSVQRNTGRKRGKPRMRFNFWILVLIFILSFLACFLLYMIAANLNKDFFEDEFNATISELQNPTEPATEAPEKTSGSDSRATDEKESSKDTVTNPIPQSDPAGENYFDRCTLLTDASLLDMKKYGGIKDVIGNKEISASTCGSASIDSSYGTLDILETMKLKKPSVLYIMLGSDIGTSSVDDMVSAYKALVAGIHKELPETDIYIMELPPVKTETETVTNDLINKYNSKLLGIADDEGVYCIDTNIALKDSKGSLSDEYCSDKDEALNEKAYETVCSYILSHTV